MAPRITLPGAGAIDLDVQEARILNVGLLEVAGSTTQTDVDNSAAPRSYIDRGDILFYDAAATYNTNDYVLFNNRVWFAIVDGVTGVEPSSTATAQWTELTRENLFLTVRGDTGSAVADLANDELTIAGGTNITTVASDTGDNDLLTINWSAALENLSNVNNTAPAAAQDGYYLQWDNTNSEWVAAEVVGSGFTILSDGTTTAEVTADRQTIEITGDGPVNTQVSQDADSANVEISVANASTSQSGLMSDADKTFLDSVAAGGFRNNTLSLTNPIGSTQISLNESSGPDAGQISTLNLSEILALDNLTDVDLSTPAVANQVLQYEVDPNNPALNRWRAVSLSNIEDHGGREWDMDVSYTTGDIVSLLVGTTRRLYIAINNNSGAANRPINTTTGDLNANWQEASILRLRDIANVDIDSNPNANELLIWDATENDWNAASLYTTFPDLIRESDFVPSATGAITGVTLADGSTRNFADENTTYDLEVADSGENAIIRLNPSEGTDDDVLLTAGTNITLTPDTGANSITIDSNQVSNDAFGTASGESEEIAPSRRRVATSFETLVNEYRDVISFRGDYDNTASYQPNDVVQFTTGTPLVDEDNLHYIRIGTGESIGVNPTTASSWRLFGTDEASVNAIGSYRRFINNNNSTTTEGTQTDTWSAATPYLQHDFVVYEEHIYVLAGIAEYNTMVGPGVTTNNRYLSATPPPHDINWVIVSNSPNLYDNQTTYRQGDIVLFDGGENVNSIYIARRGVNPGNPPVSSGTANTADWLLVRSGIVSVSDNGGAPAGLTANATLNISGGTGVAVERSGTSYSIHSAHTPVDNNIALGQEYTYIDENGDAQHVLISESGGVAGYSVATTEQTNDNARPLLNVTGGSSLLAGFSVGDTLAFQINYTFNSEDRTIIIFAHLLADSGGVNRIQVTGTVPDNDDYTAAERALFFGDASQNPTTPVALNGPRGFFYRTTPQMMRTTTAPWALTGNTDQIPDNKLENVNQTVAVTRGSGTEQLVFNVDGSSTLTLSEHTDMLNELDDVTLTTPTNEQVLQYDSNAGMWVNADLASGRLRFAENGLNVEVDGYLRDSATSSTDFTTVRTADFGGTNNRLRLQLLDESRSDSTIAFASAIQATYNWDVPSPANIATSVSVVEDPINPRFYDTLSAPTAQTSNFTINNPRARGGSWTVTYANRPQPTSTSLTGGNVGPFLFTATDSNGVITDTATSNGMGVTWRSAGFNQGPRNYGNRRNFLETYTHYTIAASTSNVTSTSSAVVDQFNFPNGDTVVTGAGQTNEPITGSGATLTELSFGGAPLVFTTTFNVYNNDTVPNDTVRVSFNRPELVTGSSYSVVNTQTFSTQPVFTYPFFYLITNDLTIPTAAQFVAANNLVRTGNTSKSGGTIGNPGIPRITATAATRYLWIAYPTGIGTPTSASITTEVPPNPASTVTVSVPSTDVSTTDLSFINQDVGTPPSAAENYAWVRLEIPANNIYTINNLS